VTQNFHASAEALIASASNPNVDPVVLNHIACHPNANTTVLSTVVAHPKTNTLTLVEITYNHNADATILAAIPDHPNVDAATSRLLNLSTPTGKAITYSYTGAETGLTSGDAKKKLTLNRSKLQRKR